MTDVKQSGYDAAAQAGLSTELDSLADDGWAALSAAIDNSSNLYLLMDLELDIGSITPTGVDAVIEVYVVPSVDGTQYPSVNFSGTGDEQENNPYFVGSFALSLDAEVQIHAIRDVIIPPGLWKMGVRNRANVTLAASANTIRWRPHGFKSV